MDSDRAAELLRICFVIDRLRLAGTEKQLLCLIRGLKGTRVKPFLVLLDGEDILSKSAEPEDCTILRLGVRSLCRPATLVAAWRLALFLRQHRIEIVQVFFPDSTYFAAPVARLAGVKHVVRTRRDLGYWMNSTDRLLGRLYNRLCTATVANCNACRQTVISQEKADPKSVHVLWNGVDVTQFAGVRPVNSGLHRSPARVGMVANVRPVKAPEVFVRAAATLVRSHSDIYFEIAGTDHEKLVQRLAEDYRVEQRIIVRGTISDVASFLNELDVAVLCSDSEGMSNAILEYMAAGRPIVATDVGANRELIEDGVHGLLVPAGQSDSFAHAVDRLLKDRALAARLGAAARVRAERTFSLSAMIRRHESFYRGLVHGCSPVSGGHAVVQ